MKTLITLIFFLCSIYSYSQSYIGVKAAFNMSSMTSGNGKANGGYSAGGFYDTPISDKLHFFPNLQFAFNSSSSQDKYKPEYYLQNYSIEAPILLSFRLKEEMFSLAFDFGPYVRYGIGGKSWTKQEDNQKDRYNTFDLNKQFDLGGQVGIGAIMNQSIYINFNIQHGFIKPSKEIRGNNITYNIGIGYAFEVY